MSIIFKTKDCPSIPINETLDLCKFLKLNKQYIKLTLNIISQEKHTIASKQHIAMLVDNPLISGNIIQKSDPAKQDYIEKLYAVYLHNADELSKIRGDILELICKEITLCSNCKKQSNLNIVCEALVINNGTPIDAKDIDIVFEHCSIDMIECKCNINNFLREPINNYTKEKLRFLNDAVTLSSNTKTSTVYLVTARSTDILCRQTLSKLGYSHFKILKSQDILKYVY